MNKDQFPIHSFLLSIYFIIFLVARNLQHIQIKESFRSMALSIGVTILMLICFRIILREWEKAGVICSLLLLLFFSFGHLYNELGIWFQKNGITLHESHLAWLWIAIFLLITFVIIRIQLPNNFTRLLNLLSFILVLSQLGTITLTSVPFNQSNHLNTEVLREIRGEYDNDFNLTMRSQYEKPDIYYIILDSYERADKLEEHYYYENSQFIESLEERNFFVLSSSRSNYLNTTFSLNTSLNLVYFHEFPKKYFLEAVTNLNINHVTDFLRKLGYKIVVFESGTGDTDDQYADIFLSSTKIQKQDKLVINAFEQMLIRTTMGVLMLKRGTTSGNSEEVENYVSASVNRELTIRRERIHYTFTHLPDYASKDGNYFLFAHIYLPHIPFLFGPNGEPLKYHENLNMYWYETAPENYDEYYVYQIKYLNKLVLSTIDQILESSKRPVVIILQADHGDGKYLDQNELTAQGVDIRSAILNAIYFSDNSYQELYRTMTPVNTFRVIFNHWFGTNYPILSDKVYTNKQPYTIFPNTKPKFTDACIEFDICLPLPQNSP
jgi:hypothetical protein